MPASRRAVLVVTLLSAWTCAACGDPPNKELQQAQRAIDTARGAGADRYARDEFVAAETALKSANDAVEQRDYRLALNRALDAEARAQSAATDAGVRKAAARTEANQAVKAGAAALLAARARVQSAVAAHALAKVLTPARRVLASSEWSLQEARTAFGREDYVAARDTARAARSRLVAATRDLDAATAPPARRKP